MIDTLRRSAALAILVLPLLAGCAGDGCEYLAYEQEPSAAPPLALPEGVAAAPESGEFRVPSASSAVTETCLAKPPMTLPPEVLVDPEQTENAEASEG